MSARKDLLMDPRQIATCAYLIWQSEGFPDGREEAHWPKAEAQLLADRADEAGVQPKNVALPSGSEPEPVRAQSSRPRKARTARFART